MTSPHELSFDRRTYIRSHFGSRSWLRPPHDFSLISGVCCHSLSGQFAPTGQYSIDLVVVKRDLSNWPFYFGALDLNLFGLNFPKLLISLGPKFDYWLCGGLQPAVW